MKIDIRTCADLEEIFHYAELGDIEGCSPEFAKYIVSNFDISGQLAADDELDELKIQVKDMEEDFEEIETIARRWK